MKTYLQYTLLTLSIVCFLFFVLELVPLKQNSEPINLSESFDSSLLFLNSKKGLFNYCDSIFTVKLHECGDCNRDSLYADITAVVIRERFYHGWAKFGIGNNYMALVLQPLFPNKSVTPIVDTKDILKLPVAICGQQARVFADVLLSKKIPVRKVLFDHPSHGGHYALEVFYENSWHFFDVNRELNLSYSRQFNRPSVEFLKANPEILKLLYIHLEPSVMLDMFTTVKTENFLKVEGPNLLFYHRVTKLLSYTIWLVFFALYLVVKNKNRM